MKTWKLSHLKEDCPIGWQNFLDDLKNTVPYDSPNSGYTIKTINRILKKYNAKYREEKDDTGVVDFYNERQYTLFVIKYGSE